MYIKRDLWNCSLSLLDSQGCPLVWQDNDYNGASSNFSIQMKYSEIFCSRRNDFLPNDILTVQCHMWKQKKLFIENMPLFALARKTPLVTKKSFTWNVTDVLSRNPEKCERVELITVNGKSLSMKLCLRRFTDLKVNITLSLPLIKIDLKVTISMLDTSGKKVQLMNKELLSAGGSAFIAQEWDLETILAEHLLRFYRSAFVHNDILSLHFSFTCTLAEKITFNGLVDKDEMPNINVSKPNKCSDESEIETSNRMSNSDTVSKAIQGMYEEGFLSDFNLKVGDRLFPVHKAVLGMRSINLQSNVQYRYDWKGMYY